MRVNVDSQVVTDPRFKKLGRAIGATWFEALGRAVVVWMESYSRRTAVFEIEDVDAIVDLAGFGMALVRAGLADSEPGGVSIRLRGVNARIDFLLAQSHKAQRGNRARWERPDTSGAAQNPTRERMPDAIAYAMPNATPNAIANARTKATADATANAITEAIPNAIPNAIANGIANAIAYSPDLSPDQDHSGKRVREDLVTGGARRFATPDSLSEMPSAWEPEEDPESVRIAASARSRGVDVVRELDAFRQHAKANEWKRRDWQATWNQWLVQAKPHGPAPTSTSTRSARDDSPTKRISDDEREHVRRMNAELMASLSAKSTTTSQPVICLDHERFEDE